MKITIINMKLLSIALALLLIVLLNAEEMGSEVVFRDMVKEQNRRKVEAHNLQKEVTYTMALHPQFADKTYEEIKALYFVQMPASIKQKLMTAQKPTSRSFFSSLTASSNINVNWVTKGFVPPVTDQGSCGSCYAHVAIADIQSSYLMKGFNYSLSIQQIVDCSSTYGNYGCQGGWMGNVFDYVLVNGVTLTKNYPQRPQTYYEGQVGECSMRRGQFRIRSYSYTSYRYYDCYSLTNIALRRPVSVAVTANYPFIYYKSGIFTGCDPIVPFSVNHAVLVVGIFQNATQNYWIARSSWGAGWGESGNIRIDRNKDVGNQCQICLLPVYSIL